MSTSEAKDAVIYCRLSPTPSVSKEENLAQQETLSRELCDRKGWRVVDVIVEVDTSASKGPRPGWERAVQMARSGQVRAIVARHPDRMYRQPRELEDLVDLADELAADKGVTLATVDGDFDLATVGGRLQARVAGAVARGEIERKAERQRMGHQRRTAEGRPWWTSRPFGFERDGSHRPAEAAAIRQAYSDVLAGKSLYAIARELNTTGLVSPRGNGWRSANLRHVLMHPRNAAIHTHLATETGSQATWEPIVGEDVFRAVVRLLSDKDRLNNGGGRRKGLLTGVARCTKCEGLVVQNWSRPNQAGDRYRIYICRAGRCISIPADWLESYVLRQVIERAPDWVSALGPVEPDEAALAVLRQEEAELHAQQRELHALAKAGLLEDATLASAVAKVTQRLEQIREAIADLRTGIHAFAIDPHDIEYLWQELDYESDPEKVRGVIEQATTGIRLKPRGKGARFPKAADVEITFRTAN